MNLSSDRKMVVRENIPLTTEVGAQSEQAVALKQEWRDEDEKGIEEVLLLDRPHTQ